MKCIKCGRPLKAYAASVETRDGLRGWGPKCARYAGFAAQRKGSERAIVRRMAGRSVWHEHQMTWEWM